MGHIFYRSGKFPKVHAFKNKMIKDSKNHNALGLRLSAQGPEIRRQGIQDQGRCEDSQRGAAKGNQEYQTNPTRHGL
jgi:hypothetical protein